MKQDDQLLDIEKRLAKVELQLEAVLDAQQRLSPYSAPATEHRRFRVRAHFARGPLQRMPFVVTIEGTERISQSLTPVRAAVLLVLLMDFVERSEGHEKQEEPLARVKQALSQLVGAGDEETTDDAVRVALYRAGQFIKEQFTAAREGISYAVENGALVVLHNNVPLPPSLVDVDITTSDQAISSVLDRSLNTSPLARLRKAKVLFVPPGNEGQDRLLLELLSSEHTIRQISLFYRPTIQSFPQELLVKLGLGPNRKLRQEIAMRAHQAGRLHYTEILPRNALQQMITATPEKGSELYSVSLSRADIISHIDHLQFLLRAVPSYELVLTDPFFPFYLNSFEITSPNSTERFVLFFQQGGPHSLYQASVFAMRDDSVFFNVQERIISWVLSHPTTVRDRQEVLAELEGARTKLLNGNNN